MVDAALRAGERALTLHGHTLPGFRVLTGLLDREPRTPGHITARLRVAARRLRLATPSPSVPWLAGRNAAPMRPDEDPVIEFHPAHRGARRTMTTFTPVVSSGAVLRDGIDRDNLTIMGTVTDQVIATSLSPDPRGD